MKAKQFDKQAKELFRSALANFGFSSEGSSRCTIWRKVSDEVFHMILPDLDRASTSYYFLVFPTSPVFEPLFEEKFPDDMGSPIENCFLSEIDGVGPTKQTFPCKYPEIFARQFDKRVRDLLVGVAVPYLDNFTSLEVMIPEIDNPFDLAFALDHLGDRTGARRVLEPEREGLRLFDRSDPEDTSLLDRVRGIYPELLEGT